MSYLEIYNEDVRDLLGKNPEAKLEVCVLYVYKYMCGKMCATLELSLLFCAGEGAS